MIFFNNRLKNLIPLLIIVFCLIPKMSASIPYNFSTATWSDASPYFGDNAIYISVWVGDGERVGINREDPRVELDVSGDFWCNGDATFDGSIYIGGGIDLTGDISIIGDITADNLFIITDLDVSEDITANTITIAGDSTFDGSVFIGDSLDVSEDLSANTLLVDTTSTLTGDATFLASCAIGVDLDVTGDMTATDLVLNGDFTSDNAFIITDLDVSEDLTAYTLGIDTDATVDGSVFIGADLDVSEDLTAYSIVLTGDITADNMFIITDLDVSEDLTANTLVVSGDATFDQSVHILDSLDVSNDVIVLGMVGINDATPDGQLDITNGAAVRIALDIDAAPSQSANIIDVDSSTGREIFTVSATNITLAPLNGYTKIGTGSTSHGLDASGDLFVTRYFEVDNSSYIDGLMTFYTQALFTDNSLLNFGNSSDFVMSFSTDQALSNSTLFCCDNTSRSIVVTTKNYRTRNHYHTAQSNPTIFIHSATDPSSDRNQWGSLAHNQTDFVISSGKGNILLDPSSDVVEIDGSIESVNITMSGDLTADNGFIITDLDVSEDLTSNTLVVTTDATVDGTLYTDGLIFPPSSTQIIDGTDDAILANAVLVVLNPDADYTTDVTPIIADGIIGQMLYITCANGEANRVRIRDQDSLASSNLQLGNTYRDITGKTILMLMFDGDDWCEVNPF